MSKRLEHDASTLEDVTQYFQTRARQLVADGYYWNKEVTELPGAYETTFLKANSDEEFKSVYLLSQYRGKGFYGNLIKNIKAKIITVPDCNIETYLTNHNVPHVTAGLFTSNKEYTLIESFYGDRKAERSQCFLMNHIDEGISILNYYGASEAAKKAFCIHPLIQNDADLIQNWDFIKSTVDAEVLGLAMEYRNIANAYLSHRKIENLTDIALSPIEDVNIMLKADKIQNYKDFLKYHATTHENAKGLDEYFNHWLQKLSITPEEFTNCVFVLKSIEIDQLY